MYNLKSHETQLIVYNDDDIGMQYKHFRLCSYNTFANQHIEVETPEWSAVIAISAVI